MSDQLVVIEKKNALQVFTGDNGLDPYVKMIRDKVKNHKNDTSTQKGRDEIKSLAHNVAKSKVYLDDLGKDLVASWKTQSAKVDKARKAMRDELVALKEEARQPLTDWEDAAAEKERIFQEKAAELKLKEQIESEHEIGLLLNEKLDRDIAEANKKEKADAEAKAKQAEKDKIAVQEKADRDAKQAKIDKAQALEKSNNDAKQAKINADNAEKKRLADVEQAGKDATKREADRQKKKKEEEIKAQKKVESDKKHVGKIRGEIKEHIMKLCKLDEKTVKSVVLALLKTDKVTINY